MAYVASGFKTLSHIGSVAGAAGSNRALHAYVTNDTAAQVETSDYFLPIYARLQPGDIILVSIDLDGTRSVRVYVVDTSAAGGVTIKRETTAVVGDQTAIASLTDNSGGSASDTLADVTEANNAGSADRVPTENAIASLAAKVNAIIAALEASGHNVAA